MDALLVKPKNKQEFGLLSALLDKMHISSRTLSDSDMEDIALLKLIEEADRSEVVSKEEVLSKLNGM